MIFQGESITAIMTGKTTLKVGPILGIKFNIPAKSA
jgi:hypothetical protein